MEERETEVQNIDPERWEEFAEEINGSPRELAVYRSELLDELGDPELTRVYLESFRKACGDDIRTAVKLFRNVVLNYWGPLVRGYVEWVMETTAPGSKIVFLLRDAWPFGDIIKHEVTTANGRECSYIYLSRAHLGIGDQSGPTQAENQELIRDYVRWLDDPRVVLVDSGCWGTILVDLHRRFGMRPQSRFFFAHNPYVPSYLGYLGMPNVFAEPLNDSFEVLMPKSQGRVTRLVRNGGGLVVPVLQRSGVLSRILHATSTSAILEADPRDVPGVLRDMVDLHLRAKRTGEWTGVLPSNSPTWEKGLKFVENYPVELRTVNPAHLLPSGYPEGRRKVDLTGLV